MALPAYGCPNLVAAALWAGGEPIYYDMSTTTFAAESGTLDDLLHSEDTVIVHVDAFGTRPVSNDGRQPSHAKRIVHDLAQSFQPYAPEWRPSAVYSVISTGRAKPLSLTVGGALISKGLPPLVSDLPVLELSRSFLVLRSFAYSASLSPLVFGALSRIPSLGIGQTRYAPLSSACKLPSNWRFPFSNAVNHNRAHYSDHLADSDRMLSLAQEAGVRVPSCAEDALTCFPLWRVPVLCSSAEGAAQTVVEGTHVGVSRLYGRTLPEIMGLSRHEVTKRWPNAAYIAERLITLPTHGRLSAAARSGLSKLLSRYAA